VRIIEGFSTEPGDQRRAIRIMDHVRQSRPLSRAQVEKPSMMRTLTAAFRPSSSVVPSANCAPPRCCRGAKYSDDCFTFDEAEQGRHAGVGHV